MADVWDLYRGDPAPVKVFADSLTPGCLVLVIAGSPCQQFTWAGPHEGRQGICGEDCHLFFAVPAVTWTLATIRPDIVVHTVVENVASMLPIHRKPILEPMGHLDARTHLATLDTQDWSHTPRRRQFLGTMPFVRPGVGPRWRL